jgi:actin-like ATPase involved in cell morphogenesis
VSGGVSSIDGLEKYYQEKFGIKINVKEDGLYSVALGGGIALGDTSLLKKISIDFN